MTELLQHWVTIQAGTRPHAPAVVGRDERVSYGQLEARSNQLARLLKHIGCRQGDRIAMLMPKSPWAVTAILGIHKADCVFVPLNSSSPAARLAGVLDSCRCRLVLAAGRVGDLLERLGVNVPIGWLGAEPAPAGAAAPRFTLRDTRRYSTAPVQYHNTRHDVAQILFTSGSTGNPKGVAITHGNVIQFVEWARQYFGMSTADRIAGQSALHVDRSTFDIFGTFAAGAELHLVAPELTLLPHKLAEFLRTSEVTQWCSTPSELECLARFDALEPHDFPTLKRLLWCGDVLSTSSLIYWMERLPHVTFTNLYGTTEATIASGYHTVARCPTDAGVDVPIGRGRDGEELLVLDDRLQPVAPGTIGDLYIRGAGLSPGYWQNPQRTAAAFLPNPRGVDPSDRLFRTGDVARVGADGLVHFVGRVDGQPDTRDYQIEIADVEAALSTMTDGAGSVARVSR